MKTMNRRLFFLAWLLLGSLFAPPFRSEAAAGDEGIHKPLAGLLCDAKLQSMLASLRATRSEASEAEKKGKKRTLDGLAQKTKSLDAAASIKALEAKIATYTGGKLANAPAALSFLKEGKWGEADAKQIVSLANPSCPTVAKSEGSQESQSKDFLGVLSGIFSPKGKK